MTDDEIRSHLANTGRVAILWDIDDVKSVRPDLTDDQCMEVLDRCDNKHDANFGINWLVIEIHADYLFPAKERAEP
jgi:hypothetical protein